jgi:hypothetical protein
VWFSKVASVRRATTIGKHPKDGNAPTTLQFSWDQRFRGLGAYSYSLCDESAATPNPLEFPSPDGHSDSFETGLTELRRRGRAEDLHLQPA